MNRLQAGREAKFGWESIEEILGSVLHKMKSRLESWPVSVHVPLDFPFLRVDAVLIEKLFTNLLENIVKHTPPGTRVAISAEDCGEILLVEVRDTGPGFSGEADHSKAGRLGLSICRAIMGLHGGRLYFRDVEAGTCACLEFSKVSAA